MDNIKGTMVGAGDAYLNGVRMTAAAALAQAGLMPVQPFGADDDTLDVTNSYATGQAALLVADGRRALEWADLIYAIDLNGMNSSITPLSSVVQAARPFKWLNWDAVRVLDMIKGGYLFNYDPKRIIQDPESMRASSIRQASAWQAWAALRDDMAIQINSSDNNPAVAEGSPQDSWELSQSAMTHYYVKGGKLSNGKHGFVFSNANWDPYPLANDIESFTLALGNLDIAVMLRQAKFASTFFTVVTAREVMPDVQAGFGGGSSKHDVMQHIQASMSPITPEGYSTDIQQVEELDAQTVLKAVRGREVVDETMQLLAFDMITGSQWMDVRKAQDPTRMFGQAPTAAWSEFRKALPLQRTAPNGAGESPGQSGPPTPAASEPTATIAYRFLMQHPASTFYPNGAAMPDTAKPAGK
jgi:histidine ammonia-lyase